MSVLCWCVLVRVFVVSLLWLWFVLVVGLMVWTPAPDRPQFCCLPQRLWGRRGFTQQPENSKVNISRPRRFQTPPKNHEKTHSDRKRANWWWETEKKSATLRGPTLRGPTLRVWGLLGHDQPEMDGQKWIGPNWFGPIPGCCHTHAIFVCEARHCARTFLNAGCSHRASDTGPGAEVRACIQERCCPTPPPNRETHSCTFLSWQNSRLSGLLSSLG